MITIKTIVCGINANGQPDFWPYVAEVESEKDIDLGRHYDIATEAAADDGFEYRVSFDEVEAPKWLFKRMFPNEKQRTLEEIKNSQ
jgi:hypothetical protein